MVVRACMYSNRSEPHAQGGCWSMWCVQAWGWGTACASNARACTGRLSIAPMRYTGRRCFAHMHNTFGYP